MVPRIDEMAARVGADLVVLDPAVPLGLVGPSLRLPYDVVLHGAEVTVPGRLPGTQQSLGLRAARRPPHHRRGQLPGAPRPSAPPAAACRSPSCRPASTPSGSDPLDDDERAAARTRFGLPDRRRAGRQHQPAGAAQGLRHGDPRRGTAAPVAPRPGAGDLRRRAATSSGCGGWPPSSTPRAVPRPGRQRRPAGAVRLRRRYTMLCRNRWGGLEQEGFGIVFLEAAACGVPQVAGDSGGAAEAVVDGVTGVDGPPPRRTRAKWPRAFEPAARRPGRCGARWAAPARSGRSTSSPTTCSPSGWVVALGALP